jgi:outer membrane beta-barrel protein
MTCHGRKGQETMKRITIALAFALLTVFGGTKIASAQEILLEGPLAGAPAVRKLVQYRQMRFSVGPQFGYTILNNYEHNFLVGARLEFNILEWLSVGVIGYYSFNAPTKLTQHIAASQDIGGQPTTPSDSNFPSYSGANNFEDQVALLKGMYLAQLELIPFRGKLAMFEKLFVAIDGAIFVGGGIVHLNEREDCNSEPVADANIPGGYNMECGGLRQIDTGDGYGSVTRKSRVTGTFTVGVGFMAYFNDWFALNLEYRVAPFKWNEGGTDESGKAGKSWELQENDDGSVSWTPVARGSGDYPDGNINKKDRIWNSNQSIAIGFIFYFPFEPKVTE